MKIASHIVAGLLGLLFLFASLTVLLHLDMGAPPKFEEGSFPALFMAAFAPSGYLTFVKVFELIGGILVIIPFTRNLGLLVLGPIIINIFAYHTFIMKGEELFPMVVLICLAAAFLLWTERKAFLGLLHRN